MIEAVAAAHEAGVVHRDLTTNNIRIGRCDRGRPLPKVLDFGISKLSRDGSVTDLTTSGDPLGTVNYMAPEQLVSAKRANERSDIYALGVILYECATGRLPFWGGSVYDRMHAILTENVIPPRSARQQSSSASRQILNYGLWLGKSARCRFRCWSSCRSFASASDTVRQAAGSR